MKLAIHIDSDNAAFDDEPATETARILRDLADRIEEIGGGDGPLLDRNGNTVGSWSMCERNC